MCEKNGPDSPSGLARTARSARLRFAFLGGLFLYKAYACLGEAKPSRLVQDKHTPKCHDKINFANVTYSPLLNKSLNVNITYNKGV